jgi:hypothetical protein
MQSHPRSAAVTVTVVVAVVVEKVEKVAKEKMITRARTPYSSSSRALQS